MSLPSHARLVIVGSGIVGCATAFHLAQLGWKDIVVVDKGPLYQTGGSTSHAPGLIFQTNYSKMLTEFAKYTVGVVKQLEYAGVECAYQVGGIEVATDTTRWEELKRKKGTATAYGLEAHLISPAEVKQHIPLVDESQILGGYYVPTDTDVRGWYCAAALAEKAIASGAAQFFGNTHVLDIRVQNGHANAVLTDQGIIECEQVLLATNVWASVLADKVGLRFPIMGVEHQYTITEPLPELAGETRFVVHPILRNQNDRIYYRQHADSYGIGSYNHRSMLFHGDYVKEKAEREFTPEDFGNAQAATNRLLPPLRGKKFVREFNGYMAFANDLYPIVGETRIGGLWSAIGVWVTHSGGVAKSIAELMTFGETEWDIREADINRFHPHDYSKSYMAARIDRQYQEVYDILHPLQQMENPRQVRLAPFFPRLQALGGEFLSSAGWEVAQWYNHNAPLLEKYGAQIPARSGWEARYWNRIQGAEHLATRETAGLFNLNAFTKIEISGNGALAFLERIAANKIDQASGKIVYTALLNSRAGIMADLTIARLAEDRFWVLTGGGVGPHDLAWIRSQAPKDGSVYIKDVSGQYATVGLWGPQARNILQSVAEEDLSNAAFPYYTAQDIRVENMPVKAIRISYAGELGWELYTPVEYGLRLWDVLWEAGMPFGMVAAGGGAFDSLRLEKGYRLWGADIHSEYNPYEAGLGWAVKLNKGEFLGRSALLKAKEAGVSRKLCCLTSADPHAMALGKELIVSLDGQRLGYVTSANFGYSIGKFICYGYLPSEYAAQGTPVQVEYFGKRWTAVVSPDPLFDPKMERMKA
ncbi:MAG TPA: FAD-dependent oxidoreductase [Anaerolineales bacterium]|nr:FAD-dependent oxidoreductase [Anaerolineales bacterium]